MNKRNAFVILLFVSLSARAAGPYAADADLRAGFCFEYVKSLSDAVNGLENLERNLSQDSKDFIAERRNQFAKLQRYLLARNQAMNADARLELMTAMKSGQNEHALFISQIDACVAKNGGDALSTNTEVCIDQVRSKFPMFPKCEKLEFLPY